MIDDRKDSLFVVPDGELKMTRDNTLLLVVTSGVASELEDFSGEVLKDGSEVDYERELVIVVTYGYQNANHSPGAPAPTR